MLRNGRGSAASVIYLLNSLIGSNYREDDPTVTGRIHELIESGYTYEQIETVVTRQVAKWYGTKYETGLKPSTLFEPSRFVEFLNAPDSEADKAQAVAKRNGELLDEYTNEIETLRIELEGCEDIRRIRELNTRIGWLQERIEAMEGGSNAIN